MKSGNMPLKLAALLAIGTAVHAAIPYLPQVGPPPLRVEAVKSPATVTVLKLAPATPAATITNTIPVVAKAPISLPSTNQVASTNNTPDEIASASAPAPEASQSLGQTFTASVFTLPTPDLVGITPQMLVTYFHPVQLGTNSAITAFPLSFVPPMPADIKSSHAEYILK
jgi:hypothetical protein